jgi:hypothetical protein
MYKFLGLFLSLLGWILLYLSHHHQALIAQKLSRIWRYFGIGASILGLILLLFSLPKLVAVLMWLAICTLICSFLPFLALFKQVKP